MSTKNELSQGNLQHCVYQHRIPSRRRVTVLQEVDHSVQMQLQRTSGMAASPCTHKPSCQINTYKLSSHTFPQSVMLTHRKSSRISVGAPPLLCLRSILLPSSDKSKSVKSILQLPRFCLGVPAPASVLLTSSHNLQSESHTRRETCRYSLLPSATPQCCTLDTDQPWAFRV